MSDFLASPWWTAATAIALVWGLSALIVLLLGGAGTPKGKAFVWSGLLLLLGLFEGLFGYSLPDDLLSGTGLRVITNNLNVAQILIGTWLGCRFRREIIARLPRVQHEDPDAPALQVPRLAAGPLTRGDLLALVFDDEGRPVEPHVGVADVEQAVLLELRVERDGGKPLPSAFHRMQPRGTGRTGRRPPW